ncbi:ISL3 family transposase [Nonomuraea sp. NPDC050022]|uniref:ISL3 family transposase n=1 Tax=Nonomuraea sp. NPDC050022 TaxID=3364358 RepID=UPI0037A88AE0
MIVNRAAAEFIVQHAGSPAGQACLQIFFPHLSELVVEELIDRGGYVLVKARTRGRPISCPGCGQPSTRLHGHYRRLLQDLPVGGRQVLIDLTVRRLKCRNVACRIRTFAEPINGLAGRHARNTRLLRRMLERLALALAGRAASRLLNMLGVMVSRDTLIRLIRALPDPEFAQVTVLGVDDWAKRRGHSYATILIDMETGRAIDVLDDRQADTLATWLREHPGVHIICRDRAGAYAEGARTGAPEATQIADRWHLWNNLCQAVEITVRTNRADLRKSAPEPQPEPGPMSTAPTGQEPTSLPEPRTAVRTRERHAAVHELVEQGWTIAAISQHLGLNRTTVRKFRNATTAEELINGPRSSRPRSFEEFIPYLRQRVADDQVVNAAQLYAELRALGYRGSRRTVRRYVEPLRAGHTVLPLPPPAPTVREVTRWITSHPDHLTADDKTKLDQILERSPRLAALSGHVTAFAQMMTDRTGNNDLKSWLAAVEADDIPQLHSFAKGIDRDLDAVINGLTLPHSSGAVEGNVTRVKAIKRSRYGRANFDLLRKIILCSY